MDVQLYEMRNWGDEDVFENPTMSRTNRRIETMRQHG